MRYKLIIAYDGTDYHGWQEQINTPTIAGVLQDIFLKVFHQKICVFGASRTDAGVHALGQVATFTCDLDIPVKQLHQAWNNKLPPAINILDLQEVADTYNPHDHVREKEYHYTVTLERPLPQQARFTYHYRWPLDKAKLQEALSIFVGTHDFRSFCTGAQLTNTVRTITSIVLEQNSNSSYTIIFKAPGFLRYMIRRITGACLEVASRPQLPITYLHTILDAKNPEHTLPCAPASGLTLMHIRYNN